MPNVSSVLSTSTATPLDQAASALPQQAISQQDFLKLLVAQLSSQDPMNPVSNTDFLAQLAQFSTLQGTQKMQSNLAGLTAGQSALQAGNLLGRTVQVQPAAGAAITGVVTAVNFQSNNPAIVINGQSYDLSQVLSVSLTPATSQPQP
jgi:flagellar basal-body rod modification protein FlgD